ncbi:MAG: hypothetical protein JO316_25810 [Abitibacteriaceae bacterium]|nr:hypothetical protein [Abditibacteriaceae bacterium]
MKKSRMLSLSTALLVSLSFAAVADAGDDKATVINAMEENNFAVPAEKVKVESVVGKTGKALKFSFAEDAKGVFVQGRDRPTPDWDKAAGFSFWVQGDGSNHLGGIEMIWNGDYGMRYAYAFPLNDIQWHKVVVPWRDLIPEVSAPIKPIDPANGNAPSKLSPINFGKWWYWGDYAAHSYAIDDIRLEPTIPTATQDLHPQAAPLARVAAKLKAGQPITIVTMGDSLTDFKHWTNRETNWPTTLQKQLKAKYGSEVKLVNPAMGGTELRQNLVVMPRWTSQEPQPDLVTVFFGFNDYTNGMRGPAFQQTQMDAIDRIRRATGGKADVLILTTCPPFENGERMGELAEACRNAAKADKAGLADVYAAFTAVPQGDREKLYANDKVHLAPPGQELVAQTVLKTLETGG